MVFSGNPFLQCPGFFVPFIAFNVASIANKVKGPFEEATRYKLCYVTILTDGKISKGNGTDNSKCCTQIILKRARFLVDNAGIQAIQNQLAGS